MSKSWVIFIATAGILILLMTAFQIIFALSPNKTPQVYVPQKPNPVFKVEVLQKISDNQKYLLINNDTLEPNVYVPFTPLDK